MQLTYMSFNSLLLTDDPSGMDSWNPLMLMPQLVTIFLVFLIMMILILSYNKSLKKASIDKAPTGIVLIGELVIKWLEEQIVDLMGTRYRGLTVYGLYLLFYLGIGNLMEVIGFDSIVSSFTVPLSLGIITFIGIYYFGIKYHKLVFFKKFLNPLELIQQFVPLISISFRIFGNVLGGSIIVLLLTSLLNGIWSSIPYLGPVDLLAGMILPFLSIYFDIFDGLVQAYIFTILTIAYWAMEMGKPDNITSDINTKKTRKIDIENLELKLDKHYSLENIEKGVI
ncbi:FoF1 ATP synthase subunit a [Spiroplasma endosymbiont of Amphibalanus improvisus]|uniref:FoF1 ATP synthase subunit A n=1 Tax=Spiroplasma endosymbiont of Amphibalanus improvisus TaxID=3066327 RepID=UPI00313B0B69